MPHLKDITTETGMVFSANYTAAPTQDSTSPDTNPFKTAGEAPGAPSNTNNGSNFREEDDDDLVGV